MVKHGKKSKGIRNGSSGSGGSLFNLALGFIVGYGICHFLQANPSASIGQPGPGPGPAPFEGTKLSFPASDEMQMNRREIQSTENDNDENKEDKNKNEDEDDAERNFLKLGLRRATDKVAAVRRLPECLRDPKSPSCTRPGCVKEECRSWGHFYHTLYQSRLGHLSRPRSTPPFQFLEIGFYHGNGYDTYQDFFGPQTELHSMEISCIPHGPRAEGKWPWDNFAKVNRRYDEYRQANRLHCGDASNITWVEEIWKTQMQRPDAPPLKVVVDDGAHLANHMATSVMFWFPRIEPGGFMVVEDIQPIHDSNLFRTQFLPQIMADLHYCGDPKQAADAPCFPTLQPLLQSIHCEMHICIFERNQKPAKPNLSLRESSFTPDALNLKSCKTLNEPFGTKMK